MTTIGELTRDLTKIHPQPKSYVKKRLIEYLYEVEKEFSKLRGFTENQHDWVDTCDVYKLFQKLRK